MVALTYWTVVLVPRETVLTRYLAAYWRALDYTIDDNTFKLDE